MSHGVQEGADSQSGMEAAAKSTQSRMSGIRGSGEGSAAVFMR